MTSQGISAASKQDAANRLFGYLLSKGLELEIIYDYFDNNHNLLYHRARFSHPDGSKQIRPFHKSTDGLYYPTEPPFEGKKPLYGSQLIEQYQKANTWVVEGEKCADCLNTFFHTEVVYGDNIAITSGGATSEGKADWSSISNRCIFIFPDNDSSGNKYAIGVATILQNNECSVEIINVSKLELKESGDVVDWLEMNENHRFIDLMSLKRSSYRHAQAGDEKKASNDNKLDALEPDLSLLNYEDNFKPPSLPKEIFEGRLWEYMKSAAECAGAPIDYIFGALITSAASLIGNSRLISPWDGWEAAPALWIAQVGNPSSGKTPAMSFITKLVSELEYEMQAEYKEEYPNAEQPAPRIRFTDTSIEALARLQAHSPKGLLLDQDELAGFFASLNRYSGRENSDRPFYLQSHNGGRYSVDRVKHGSNPIQIPRLLVSIIGGIQPDKVYTLLNDIDDGLMARFLYIWPNPVPPTRPTCKPDSNAVLCILKRLSKLDLLKEGDKKKPLIMHTEEKATQHFQQWREEHHIATKSAEGLMASFLGKAGGNILKLALVLEYLWWASSDLETEPKYVSAMAISAAQYLFEEYFKPMAENVYTNVLLTKEERWARILARRIYDQKLLTVNKRDLYKYYRIAGLNTADKAAKVLAILEEDNWFVTTDKNEKGRPRGDYNVNTKVWEYADE